jgi:phosphohistidine phosphatase
MRLFLLRHGKAVARDEWDEDDSLRPLSKGGVVHAERVLSALAPFITAQEIFTSPWTRARQTAEVASSIWKLPLQEVDWLAGGAADAAERTRHLNKDADIVLVGHEPDLSLLAKHLCGAAMGLKKCGLAILEGRPAPEGMELMALLPPKMILSWSE